MKNVAIAVVGIVVGLWALPSLAADAANAGQMQSSDKSSPSMAMKQSMSGMMKGMQEMPMSGDGAKHHLGAEEGDQGVRRLDEKASREGINRNA